MFEIHSIDPKAVGVEVSWSFGYGDAEAVCLDRREVRKVFVSNGITEDRALEVLPEFNSDDALKRALRYAPKKKHIAIKEFARPNDDTPRAIGIYVRDEIAGEGGDDWCCEARVRYNAMLGAIECLSPEGMDVIQHAEAQAIGCKMAVMATSAMRNAANVDLSLALCDLGQRAGWITRRRNAGGVYFFPANTPESKDQAARFVQILSGLAALTEHLGRDRQFIPQAHDLFPSPMTMSSWGDSARDNFEADVEKLQKELDRMVADGKMRDTTKAERAAQVDEIVAKAESYRAFLGTAVEEIGGKLAAIKAAFVDAIGENTAAAEAALGAVDSVGRGPSRQSKPREVKQAVPARGRRALSDDEIFDL